MNDVQRSYMSMYRVVRGTCDKNAAAWSALPPFAAKYTEFKDIIAALEHAIADQMVTTQPATAQKASLRTALAAAGAEVADALQILAKVTADSELALLSKVTGRQWATSSAKALVGYAKGTLDLGTTHLAALAPYGITQAKLDALQALNDQFSEAIKQPEALRQKRKEASQQLASLLQQARSLLKEHLDVYVQALKYSQEDFYRLYKLSREIDKPGHRAIALRVRVLQGPMPLAGASVSVKGQKGKKVTGGVGECRFKHLPEGKHEVTISADGFATQTMTVYTTKNVRTDVKVEMERVLVG